MGQLRDRIESLHKEVSVVVSTKGCREAKLKTLIARLGAMVDMVNKIEKENQRLLKKK